jgi:hypothetical protein
LEADANNYLRRTLEDRQPFHAGQELPGQLEADGNNYRRKALEDRQIFFWRTRAAQRRRRVMATTT